MSPIERLCSGVDVGRGRLEGGVAYIHVEMGLLGTIAVKAPLAISAGPQDMVL